MRKIDNAFIIEYQITCHNHLGKRSMGGTDELFAWRTAPSFYDILDITKPKTMLQLGFNAGHSTLMFLMIMPELIFHDIDIRENKMSDYYLNKTFYGWDFFLMNSMDLCTGLESIGILNEYSLVFLDGDHSYDGVVNDIEKALLFKPEYILFDDVHHPSHSHIYTLITETYKDKLEIVKEYRFDDLWVGYSMALCKVKY